MPIHPKSSFDNILAHDLLEMLDDAFFFFDYDLHFLFANKNAEKLCGKTKKDLIGKTVLEIFPKVNEMAAYKAYRAARKKDRKTFFKYYSPDLSKWLAITVYATKVGMRVYARDITDKIVAEEKAKENKEILNAFFEHSPVGLAIYDENMQELKVDGQSISKFVGKTPTEAIGKSLQELIPQNIQSTTSIFKEVLRKNKPVYSVTTFQDKQGNIRHTAFSRFPLFFADGKRGVGAVMVDITEQVKSERSKEDFIVMTSHELKTPLTGAKIFTQLLQQRLKQGDDKKSGELTEKLEDTIEQLEDLIKKLIDATILSHGQTTFKRERFILRDIALNTITDLQMGTEHKLVVDWQTHEYIYADKAKVSQIFTNFITNAIKYSPSATDIIIKSQKHEDFIVVSIQDFGIGIPKADKMHLFNRFYQSSKHNTYPGLGLGLYIAKEIVTKMGGKIWLKSKEGKGSKFYFTLPIYKDEMKEEQHKHNVNKVDVKSSQTQQTELSS